MKKILLSVYVFLLLNLIAIGQKASDVLEDGIPVKYGNKIFLKYDLQTKALLVDAAKKNKNIDLTPVTDSMIFLIRKTGVNIYLRPLNPLNYGTKTEYKTITDPINQDAAKALISISDLLGKIPKQTLTGNNENGKAPKGIAAADKDAVIVFGPCPGYNKIESLLKDINDDLKNDQKDEIIKIFKNLKGLSFEVESSTKRDLTAIEESKALIEEHFEDLFALITTAGDRIKEYNCNSTWTFITQHVYNIILRDLTATATEQRKRLQNLQSAFKVVQEAIASASKGGEPPELPWCTKLECLPVSEGKISLFTITINESGYVLSDKDEIVAMNPKAVVKKTLRVRKYSLFIPEVSVGTAYTTFKYNTYGTTTDAGGQMVVGSPVENTVRNLKFTSMVNFNLFIPNTPVHPLWQFGVGVNSDAPVILIGAGARINIKGRIKIGITGGGAFTFIKELDKLKVGDKVSGTDDINKDLKYQFSWPPKAYIGLQVNF